MTKQPSRPRYYFKSGRGIFWLLTVHSGFPASATSTVILTAVGGPNVWSPVSHWVSHPHPESRSPCPVQGASLVRWNHTQLADRFGNAPCSALPVSLLSLPRHQSPQFLLKTDRQAVPRRPQPGCDDDICGLALFFGVQREISVVPPLVSNLGCVPSTKPCFLKSEYKTYLFTLANTTTDHESDLEL